MNELDTYLKAYQGNIIYDFDNEILLNWYPKRILHHIGTLETVLELGLGHGFSTIALSKYAKEYTVLDGSNEVINNFKRNNPDSKANIIETYFEDFTPKKKYDVIIMGFILEHVENPVEIIKKYKNYISSSGSIFITVPNAEVLNRRLGVIAGDLKQVTDLSDNDKMLGHKRYYSIETLTNDVKKAGCKVDLIEGIYLKPFMTEQIRALKLKRSYIDALCEIGIHYPELSSGLFIKISKK